MANILTVSALNRYVKSVLESDQHLLDIAIKGEISNFTKHYKTGHCYFSLKDENATVSAVMFQRDAARLAFSPENGMAVMARCRVSLYERDGRFQIYVSDIFPDGIGAAQMAFEQLKKRLEAEGLFDVTNKKMLPAYPACVGLVTSKTGAALQDIIKVATARCPVITFKLAPVTVQGAAAAPEIAGAITALDNTGACDIIVVARGGGSAEDLWVFNAEIIARAAFACKTPLVSAIGHEIDYSILDFVADLRAPTPSAAAEMVLSDLQHTMQIMNNIYTNIADTIHYELNSCYNMVQEFCNHPALSGLGDRVVQYIGQVQNCRKMLQQAMQQHIQAEQHRLATAISLAGSLNPYQIMVRGYSVLSHNGQIVNSVQSIQPGQQLHARLLDGEISCHVLSVKVTEASDAKKN